MLLSNRQHLHGGTARHFSRGRCHIKNLRETAERIYAEEIKAGMSEGVEDANVCSINNRNRCDGMRVSLWLDFNSYRFRDGRPSERAATGKATVRAARWYWSMHQKLNREYKRLYPSGTLLRRFRLMTALMFACLFIYACSLGFFSVR